MYPYGFGGAVASPGSACYGSAAEVRDLQIPTVPPDALVAATAAASPSAEHPAEHPGAWPSERLFGRASALKLGMWLFLLSDAFSFGGLLITYGVLRGAATVWWNPGEPGFGIGFTAALTFLLICSSLSMVLAVSYTRAGERGRALGMLALTALGGIAFLIGQVHEYFGIGGAGLIEAGLRFGASQRATTFYVITSFHGAHVTAGVVILLVALVRLMRTSPAALPQRADFIESVGLFWHFVDLVWILVFTFIYLVPEAGPTG